MVRLVWPSYGSLGVAKLWFALCGQVMARLVWPSYGSLGVAKLWFAWFGQVMVRLVWPSYGSLGVAKLWFAWFGQVMVRLVWPSYGSLGLAKLAAETCWGNLISITKLTTPLCICWLSCTGTTNTYISLRCKCQHVSAN
jgi:hypothetical protein